MLIILAHWNPILFYMKPSTSQENQLYECFPKIADLNLDNDKIDF